MSRDRQPLVTFIMFAILAIMLVSCITGCSTAVPVTAKFPDAPKLGLGTCPQLQTVQDGVKLSQLTNTVTMNYFTYYECAVKSDQWNEWYEIQKRIFESVK